MFILMFFSFPKLPVLGELVFDNLSVDIDGNRRFVQHEDFWGGSVERFVQGKDSKTRVGLKGKSVSVKELARVLLWHSRLELECSTSRMGSA